MKQIVLGTAGHIDHGKTTLIKALTGIETDRLKEEKKRGITIELGFAYLDLPSGQRLGIVDVPGHEKFVKNMVAGAAGIDMVALIIAADEGVMPQTREHMDICSLLGVEKGLVVLTKVDMVDEEWLELVTEDVNEYLEGTFLEGANVLPVSSTTGQGLDELKAELDRLAGEMTERSAQGPFRLPVDRVFTMKGFGTVVTGTVVDGKVELGQEIEVMPQGVKAKVRGVQVHNEEVEIARRGQRTAINLQGLGKSDLNRGDVLSQSGVLTPSLWVDVELTALEDMQRPLKHRAPIRFHTGSSEIMGRIMLLDRDEMAAGEKVLCQLRLENMVAVAAGDRLVLRSYSPVTTIAGGHILHPHPGRHKRNQPVVMADLETLRSGDPKDRIIVHVRLAEAKGMSLKELLPLTNLGSKVLNNLLSDMLSKQELVRFDKENGVFLEAKVLAGLIENAENMVGEYHHLNPLKPGISKEELKQRLGRDISPKLFNYILKKMTDGNTLKAEKDILRLPGHEVRLAEDEEALKKKLLNAIEKGGFTPPRPREVVEGDDLKHAKELLRHMVDEGVLVKVKEDLYYHHESLNEIKTRLGDYLKENERITTPEFKDLTGLSRKYLIPLLEYFDTSLFTMRVGEERILRKRS
ncbi:selenocysteine-specific translation elongation factor [Dethiosulfatarculus sandiegensis]|uniref:Selenocysteine-specific elongation factor n=1 Tax=Dethiosulfatarculus sandiegensis TaxID=1429043 RepID=A0A0D2K1N5_9BACT|nr:selenocysteine-specific translation elongation factor [Dethiosulfatarculus sandiegensis]KIX15585.1 translation elongation factor [Dethiosulfatarculus sandiegensis]